MFARQAVRAEYFSPRLRAHLLAVKAPRKSADDDHEFTCDCGKQYEDKDDFVLHSYSCCRREGFGNVIFIHNTPRNLLARIATENGIGHDSKPMGEAPIPDQYLSISTKAPGKRDMLDFRSVGVNCPSLRSSAISTLEKQAVKEKTTTYKGADNLVDFVFHAPSGRMEKSAKSYLRKIAMWTRQPSINVITRYSAALAEAIGAATLLIEGTMDASPPKSFISNLEKAFFKDGEQCDIREWDEDAVSEIASDCDKERYHWTGDTAYTTISRRQNQASERNQPQDARRPEESTESPPTSPNKESITRQSSLSDISVSEQTLSCESNSEKALAQRDYNNKHERASPAQEAKQPSELEREDDDARGESPRSLDLGLSSLKLSSSVNQANSDSDRTTLQRDPTATTPQQIRAQANETEEARIKREPSQTSSAALDLSALTLGSSDNMSVMPTSVSTAPPVPTEERDYNNKHAPKEQKGEQNHHQQRQAEENKQQCQPPSSSGVSAPPARYTAPPPPLPQEHQQQQQQLLPQEDRQQQQQHHQKQQQQQQEPEPFPSVPVVAPSSGAIPSSLARAATPPQQQQQHQQEPPPADSSSVVSAVASSPPVCAALPVVTDPAQRAARQESSESVREFFGVSLGPSRGRGRNEQHRGGGREAKRS
jgi:hypothetical protein